MELAFLKSIDLRNCYSGGTFAGMRIRGAEYIELHDIEMRNLWARGNQLTTNIINLQNSTHIVFDHCSFHDNSEAIFSATTTDTIIIRNTDVYNACDTSEVGGGTDADGFIIGTGASAGENTHYYLSMTGCRAWNTSDDGFDIAHTKNVHIDSCWAFWGAVLYDEDLQGDGSGFKFGAGDSLLKQDKRTVTRCLSIYNMNKGIEINNAEANGNAIYWSWYNNTIYKCRAGFSSACGGASVCWTYANDSGYVDVTNNLIYDMTNPNAGEDGYSPEYLTQWGSTDPTEWVNPTTESWVFLGNESHPSWNDYNPSFTITDADFSELDSATIFSQLSAARKTDGSLPDITVLKLDSESELVGGGTDVGYGDDLGAFQYPSEGSSDKDVISINCTGQVSSTINTTAKTVDVVLGIGYDKSSVSVLNLNVSPGASHDLTATDFSSAVTTTVTGADASTQDWVIKVKERNPINPGGTKISIGGVPIYIED